MGIIIPLFRKEDLNDLRIKLGRLRRRYLVEDTEELEYEIFLLENEINILEKRLKNE